MKDAGRPVSSAFVGFLRGRLFTLVFFANRGFVSSAVRGREFLLDLFRNAALARVIGNVPALALELNRRRGKLLLKRAAAFAAAFRLLVRGAHQDFEMCATFFASIFVNWHDGSGSIRLYECV